MRLLAIAAILFSTSASAVELPDTTFFSGNDIYQWCQSDKAIALGYVGGIYDAAVHGTFAIDGMRNFGKDMPNNDAQGDFAIKRVIGFCKPKRATLEQMTDLFCNYLKEFPAQRDGVPAILFNEAGKRAWPCPDGK